MKRFGLLTLLALIFVTVVLALTAKDAPAGSGPEYDYDFVVVRAYFDDPQMVQEVAQWKEPWEVNYERGYLVIDATPAEYEELLAAGFRLEIDLALTKKYNEPPEFDPNQGGGIPGFACYRTVEETFSSAQQMANDYPDLVTWTDIGDSWDKATPGGPAGYDMMALRLTNINISGPKPVLLLFGGIHAREYASPELVMRYAEYLVTNYNLDPDITWLLDYHEIHMILYVNPDGRKIAEGGELWRKNRNNTDGCTNQNLFGVDLNRNFQFYWNNGGSSNDPCQQTYHGSGAASEPETQAVQDYGISIFPDQRDDPITSAAPITTTGIFLDIHSYGQIIIRSWGFTPSPAPNDTGLLTLSRKMGYFNTYDPALGSTSGSTKDFFYGEFGVPGFTVEVGTTFFQSCSYFENAIVPRNIPTLLYAAKASRFSYIIPAGPDATDLALSASDVQAGAPVDLTATINDTRYNQTAGTEPTQNIIAAEYYIDVPPWITTTTPISISLDAVDGVFDNPIEAVEGVISTGSLSIGRHTIFVRGQDADGNWGAISAAFLEILDPQAPTASFYSSSPDLLGATTVFTNTSSGTNLSYLWDFGNNGLTSTLENPTYQYPALGTYTVTLTVTNNFGTDETSGTVEILRPPNEPLYLYLPLQFKGSGLVADRTNPQG